jgi:hypothetical protein
MVTPFPHASKIHDQEREEIIPVKPHCGGPANASRRIFRLNSIGTLWWPRQAADVGSPVPPPYSERQLPLKRRAIDRWWTASAEAAFSAECR